MSETRGMVYGFLCGLGGFAMAKGWDQLELLAAVAIIVCVYTGRRGAEVKE